MKFLVKEKHFVNGIMRMKCTATVARMYQMSKESIESIEPDDGGEGILKMSENLSQGESYTSLLVHLYVGWLNQKELLPF